MTPCSTRLRSVSDMPAWAGMRTKKAEPKATSMWVRSPAALPYCSRCHPNSPPKSAASSKRVTSWVIAVTPGRSAKSACRLRHTSCHMVSVIRLPHTRNCERSVQGEAC